MTSTYSAPSVTSPRNPVEAGLVDDPLAWPWSSARTHAGIEQATIPLNEQPLRNALDNSPRWRNRYAELIEADAPATEAGSAYARLTNNEPPSRAPLGGWRGNSKEGEPKVPPLGLTSATAYRFSEVRRL
jgi:hypothetical protein